MAHINNKIFALVVMTIALFIFSLALPNTQAQQVQTSTTFTPADKFSIPSNNAIISFGVNGSYSKVSFENNSWTFTNLDLNQSVTSGNLQFSALNCNVTIFSYTAFNNIRQTLRLNYVVVGDGNQSFNFGIGPQTGQFAGIDWSVVKLDSKPNVFLTQGIDWTLSHDGTVTVKGATGNYSIIHFGFNDASLSTSNLPFYQQHSVAITIAVLLVTTVAIAVIIKVRNTESLKNNELEKKSKNKMLGSPLKNNKEDATE